MKEEEKEETKQVLGDTFEQVVEFGVGPKDGPGGLGRVGRAGSPVRVAAQN